MTREKMTYDVVIVGAGPSGLACAIRLKQCAAKAGQDLSVCVLEKGSEVGAHLLSGAVLEPRALDELIPDWREQNPPEFTPVTEDKFYYMTEAKAIKLPTPPQMHNDGNMMISLSQYGRWLAQQAEALGVEIYPGFAAAEILYEEIPAELPHEPSDFHVIGVATGDMGVNAKGEKTAQYTPGVEIHAKQTVFAEGARGSLTKQLVKKYNLRVKAGAEEQTYGLGVKEVWEIDPSKHQEGLAVHTIGWPLKSDTYGGSWIYHMKDCKVSIGYVVGLDYKNPYLSPFEEMQRFKTHPMIKELLEGGKRIAYGARALVEGGIQSVPELVAPRALIIGDSAGFVNVPKIKGNHTAMKSGMVAAEALFDRLQGNKPTQSCIEYPTRLKRSWVWQELHAVRNIRPSFRFGLWGGIAYSAIDTYLFRGRAPWTLHHAHTDHGATEKASKHQPIDYPKPDGVLTFDRLSSVYLTGTFHAEDQPNHLTLAEPETMIKVNHAEYASPETRYCPAAVYEIVEEDGKPQLQINAQNCIHCKTCDIKDITQNINWVVPEGGGGPKYSET